jgi:hypothetical protein
VLRFDGWAGCGPEKGTRHGTTTGRLTRPRRRLGSRRLFSDHTTSGEENTSPFDRPHNPQPRHQPTAHFFK